MRLTHTLPSISVVIPNRDDSVYLEKCLNSVLTQSIAPDEIIFVDDQSSDQSLEIADRILSKSNKAQIVTNSECLGTMGALNEGLRRATCDYVLFLASNDFILKGLIEHAKQSIYKTGFPGIWSAMVWAANAQGCPLYVYPSSVVRLDGSFITPEDCVRLAMKTASWFMGTTLFFQRKALSEIGGFDTDLQGLADLLAALTISSIHGATFLAEPLGVMRMHDGGYLSNTMGNLDNLEKILEIIVKKGPVFSSRLFQPRFCTRLKNRFRFAAIRAIEDLENVEWPKTWKGIRYNIFMRCVPLMKTHKMTKMIFALLLLRPFDILPMFFYRLMGFIFIRLRETIRGSKKHLAGPF